MSPIIHDSGVSADLECVTIEYNWGVKMEASPWRMKRQFRLSRVFLSFSACPNNWYSGGNQHIPFASIWGIGKSSSKVPLKGDMLVQSFNTESSGKFWGISFQVVFLCWQGTISRVISLDVGDTCEKYAADLGAKLSFAACGTMCFGRYSMSRPRVVWRSVHASPFGSTASFMDFQRHGWNLSFVWNVCALCNRPVESFGRMRWFISCNLLL